MARSDAPLLMVDIDGVVSLFGFSPQAAPAGSFHWIEGIPHFVSATATTHLLALGNHFELVWCSGWEERANEYLPSLLGLPTPLPFLCFEGGAGTGGNDDGDEGRARDADATPARIGKTGGLQNAAGGIHTTSATHGHWKLAAIDAYAGTRPLAWIDDCLDAACHVWAAERAAPTLLVQTHAAVGITNEHAQELIRWAGAKRAF